MTSPAPIQQRAMTLAQFIAERGGTSTGDVDAHIHAALRSRPETKTFARTHARQLRALQDARTATVEAYRAAIASGEIREPTRLERLTAHARGNPENPSVRAARNVLAKRQAAALAREAGQ